MKSKMRTLSITIGPFTIHPRGWLERLIFWLTPSRPRHDDEADLVAGGEDTIAIKYVKMVCSEAMANGLTTTVEITARDGLASCPTVDLHAPFIEVRNRIAVMTDTIAPWSSHADQHGHFQVMMRGCDDVERHADVEVEMQVKADRIILTFQPMVDGPDTITGTP